ncbi:MAG: rRNA maturation RNase YbeY [Ignavibacteria bacterium]
MSLGKLADDILKSENVNVSALNIIFCSDEFIRDHNKRFLGHDYETDIITFHDTEEEGRIEGELLISIDTVKSNATKYKTTLNNELRRVVIHGILHLCGYNDKTHAEKKQIRKKEDHFLNNK